MKIILIYVLNEFKKIEIRFTLLYVLINLFFISQTIFVIVNVKQFLHIFKIQLDKNTLLEIDFQISLIFFILSIFLIKPEIKTTIPLFYTPVKRLYILIYHYIHSMYNQLFINLSIAIILLHLIYGYFLLGFFTFFLLAIFQILNCNQSLLVSPRSNIILGVIILGIYSFLISIIEINILDFIILFCVSSFLSVFSTYIVIKLKLFPYE